MNILAIGPHPDDVEIGCGGTLLKMKERGHNTFILVMTYGDFGGEPEKRMAEQQAAADFMGVTKLYWGAQKDTAVPVNKSTISLIEDVINDCKADLVMFNHPDDTHQDHRAVAKCAISATRYMKKVLIFEMVTSVDFSPNIFVNIEPYIDKKEELMRCHYSQIERKNGSKLSIAQSVQAFAIFRGYQAKVKYAEAFCAHRLMVEDF